MHGHYRQQVDSFFHDCSLWQEACKQIIVNYVAFKYEDEITIAKARIIFRLWSTQNENREYEFTNLIAGTFNMMEEGISIKEFFEKIESGIFITPNGKLSFPPVEGRGYSTYYNPLHSDGLNAGHRLGVLHIKGSRIGGFPRGESLDWDLKSASIPFDSLADLLLELSLGVSNIEDSEIEFVYFSCLHPDRSKEHGQAYENIARPALILANGLDKSKSSLGYRVINRGIVVKRNRIHGLELDWQDVENGSRGKTEFSIPDGAVVHCIGSYDGQAHFEWWVSDPSKVQNPFRAAYSSFDQNLGVLSEFLKKDRKKGSARDLETAFSWLLWLLGFKVAHLGAVPRNSDAPDIIATTSRGNFLVVECTTSTLNADKKLPLLVQRTELLREHLDISGNRHLKTLPVIVTTLSRNEVAAEIEQAEKLGVTVVTQDDFESLLNRTLTMPDEERIFSEAQRTASEGRQKHSQRNPLAFQ